MFLPQENDFNLIGETLTKFVSAWIKIDENLFLLENVSRNEMAFLLKQKRFLIERKYHLG